MHICVKFWQIYCYWNIILFKTSLSIAELPFAAGQLFATNNSVTTYQQLVHHSWWDWTHSKSACVKLERQQTAQSAVWTHEAEALDCSVACRQSGLSFPPVVVGRDVKNFVYLKMLSASCSQSEKFTYNRTIKKLQKSAKPSIGGWRHFVQSKKHVFKLVITDYLPILWTTGHLHVCFHVLLSWPPHPCADIVQPVLTYLLTYLTNDMVVMIWNVIRSKLYRWCCVFILALVDWRV